MGDVLDPRDVERAKSFWAEKDVEQVFTGVSQYLDHLKQALQRKTALDKEYVQAQRLLECLDLVPLGSPPDQDQDSSVVQVVIGSGGLLPAHFNGLSPPAGREELLPPLAPVQLQYHPHPCCKACLPGLPRTPQSSSQLYGQNPLKVPLLCGFKRLSAMPLVSPTGTGPDGLDVAVAGGDWDVIYKTPCGQSLRNFQEVESFLSATESHDVLQVDYFTFNHLVQLDPTPLPAQPQNDLSRGAEPVPVELVLGEGGGRPAGFRYRKDRWPHGCFLSRGAALFDTCCDCSDGCSEARRCACVAMTTGGRGYSYQRLLEPVQSGLFECGPWCGCDRARCQNRLVQRGVRVRLQVFETEDRGWGVRCRDDLDRGTFVCIYAGVVLQRAHSPTEPLPPKLTRAELPSDDEVEVVTEWLAPPILEARSDLLEAPPPPTGSAPSTQHVPVIQRPGESSGAAQNHDQVGSDQVGSDQDGGLAEVRVAVSMDIQEDGSPTSFKRGAEREEVCFIDASKEGNVGRFINHSCQPNLFIQNVFTDSHDPAFPVIAFFTNRVVKAGTELTWNYSDAHTSTSEQEQEVPCLCRSNGCQGWLHLEEKLCDVCAAEGPGATEEN
ncbi:histone-lysine N-methyltransferase SETDB2-like isoform X3 [Poeciliopsis prolifica]|uniref:histone-lysine N-methyltransferase SETDB2-like isoform X3 n=1 Tax=Poeciliopsis prolifica TaxID=188132 RepID=UPI0024141ACF|nr:histone-lysine N-methyltransferase SETDB2-like isoform X3 [Poeciliopsis prolifica]